MVGDLDALFRRIVDAPDHPAWGTVRKLRGVPDGLSKRALAVFGGDAATRVDDVGWLAPRFVEKIGRPHLPWKRVGLLRDALRRETLDRFPALERLNLVDAGSPSGAWRRFLPPGFFERSPSLRELVVGWSDEDDAETLAGASGLRRLVLFGTPSFDRFAPLHGHPIEHLGLETVSEIPRWLAAFPSLTSVALRAAFRPGPIFDRHPRIGRIHAGRDITYERHAGGVRATLHRGSRPLRALAERARKTGVDAIVVEDGPRHLHPPLDDGEIAALRDAWGDALEIRILL